MGRLRKTKNGRIWWKNKIKTYGRIWKENLKCKSYLRLTNRFQNELYKENIRWAIRRWTY